jgi:hypothetical protein
MNERFWELVEQADEQGGDDPDIRDQVFAELIVRECMRKTAGYLLEDEFGGKDVKEASEELAKHFGVE